MKHSVRRHLRFALLLFTSAAACAQGAVRLASAGVSFTAEAQGTRYGFATGSKAIVFPSPKAGILLNGKAVTLEAGAACTSSPCTVRGTSSDSEHLTLRVTVEPHHATLTATPEHPGSEIRFVTAGAAPAYGLADHAVEQKTLSTRLNKQYDTEQSGFQDDHFLSGQGQTRLVSNFVIYPKQGFAELLIDPGTKIVHTSAEEIVQGVAAGSSIGDTPHASVTLHYFFGTPHDIYKGYLDARNNAGYRVMMPKYEAFGIGWEAFGALGWETNAKTDTDSIDHYLQLGYPLRWVVIGSGFWPAQPDSMHETTSFGLWDHEKYPDPRGMVQHFKDEKLTVMLGLRITFITTGPYAAEGVAKGYFLKDASGNAMAYTGGWPKMPYYLLNAHDPATLEWYMGLVRKWQDYGISGWKEDFYGYGMYPLRDDKVDPTNDGLMAQHQLLIERNGYLSSNGDTHRINDFNWNQNQDRGPVNALAFAYSGFPFVYPDIVGGTFGENHFSTARTPRMETYMQRNAEWAALHASMGMGEPPWTFDAKTAAIMLKSAQLHDRIAPYLFSNARRSVADGYPWTMTPLPIAFPDDAGVYGRENATDRGYEWLIGDSLLATPVYGDDYETATARDIYLPAGTWMDYDTGQLYEGRQTLKNFALPAGKTPLFVGGSGIVLEKQPGPIDAPVLAAIYPLGQRNASSTLTLPASAQPFTVSVEAAPREMWASPTVTDRNGKPVATAVHGRALTFQPIPGESYTVRPAK